MEPVTNPSEEIIFEPNYNIEEYRKQFLYLHRDCVYLNHAFLGILPKVALNGIISNYLNPKHTYPFNTFQELAPVIDNLRKNIGLLINSPPGRIAFLENTSACLNLIASSILWESGDAILLMDCEFPANVYPFLNQRHHGVEIEFFPHSNGYIDIDRLESVIQSHSPKMLTISHVQFSTGVRADLETIGDLCQKYDVVFCVDAIQSAGVINIDVQKMKIDFLASGSQKWLMAPEGSSFFYISEELQENIKQSYVGWRSVKDSFNDFLNYNRELDESAQRFEIGTPNFMGLIGMEASVRILLDIGIKNIESYILSLTGYLIERLQNRGIRVITPLEGANRAGIVSFLSDESRELFQLLDNNKIYISLREGCIRVSPHFYNIQADINNLVDVIDNLHKSKKEFD